jgi:ankyrin repeat protein
MLDLDRDLLQELCQNACKNGNVNNLDDESYTLLHHACRSKTADLQLVVMLIKHGADINCLTMYKKTPLHLAAQWGHIEIVKYLISKNANINTKDCSNMNPIFDAYSERQNDIVKILIENGATYEGTNIKLMEMVEQYRPEVCYL